MNNKHCNPSKHCPSYLLCLKDPLFWPQEILTPKFFCPFVPIKNVVPQNCSPPKKIGPKIVCTEKNMGPETNMGSGKKIVSGRRKNSRKRFVCGKKLCSEKIVFRKIWVPKKI